MLALSVVIIVVMILGTTAFASPSLPSWFVRVKESPGAKKLDVREWVDEEWRNSEGGWKGNDYVHSPTAACRILEYVMRSGEGSAFPSIVGACYFSSRAESHKGFCHGGSLCALMDDCVGWLGFCVTGECKPWSGYTVQIDTTLKKPIPVGALLKIEGQIESVERRKVWIKCVVSDEESGHVYGEARGLFLTNPAQSTSSVSEAAVSGKLLSKV